MGADNSVLDGCGWEEPLVCPTGFPWKLLPVYKADGMKGLVLQPLKADKKDIGLLQKSAQMLRKIRHPNILRFLGCGRSSDTYWLATELATPVVCMSNEMFPHELVAGLFDTLQALDFLHTRLAVSHNNVCPNALFVSSDGSWKLGGMEHACKFIEATPEFLDACRAFRSEDSLAPEEKAGTVKLDPATSHSRDIFAFGCLVDSISDLIVEKDSDEVSEMQHELGMCMASDPAARPSAASLISLPLFHSDLLDIISFLKNIAIKSADQRVSFFSDLVHRLRGMSEEIMARRLVMPLLSRFVLLDKTAEKELLPNILTPKKEPTPPSRKTPPGLLSEPLYARYVVPHLCNIFLVHDCHVRLILLEHFSSYVHLFSAEQLTTSIFLQVLLGIRDTDDRLVAASLRALADLVPHLGGDYVIGGSRKTFFFHGAPKMEANEKMQELEPEKPHNLTTALPTTASLPGTVALHASTTGKTLLKDLARDARKTSMAMPSDKEREKRQREREQRREEARLRKEERKKKLKEKEIFRKEAENSESKLADLKIEEANMDSVKGGNDLKHCNENGEDNLKEDKHFSDSENVSDLKEEKEGSDWSDWENPDVQLNDEIEDELKNMPNSVFVEDKVQTSPNPYTSPALHPVPAASDSSNAGESPAHNHGSSPSNKLKKHSHDAGISSSHHSTRSDSHPAPSAKNGDVGSTSSQNSLKLKSSTSKTPVSSKKTKDQDDLGFGLDIKSIEIHPKFRQEYDLFAEMTPVITTQKFDLEISDLKKGSQDDSGVQSGGAKPQGGSSMFAVSAAEGEIEESGWGNDDDWNLDNF